MPRRRAFTLLELLVTVAIIAALLSMLIPTIGMVRERAHRASCSANLRSLTFATFSYMQDNRGLMLSGGTWNSSGSPGMWWANAQATVEQYLVESQQANSSAAAEAPYRYMHCPANRLGYQYTFLAGQPYDHPAQLARVINCAQRWNAPGGMPALWADNCVLAAGSSAGDFNSLCNHKGKRTGPTSGIPAGGNCSFGDGSVAWLPYSANNAVSERAFIVNGGSIGPTPVPNCIVWMRLNTLGNLDTAYTFNLVVGRSGMPYVGNF